MRNVMERISVTDLHRRTSEIVRRIREENASFAVTLRGCIVARIVPVKKAIPTPVELTEFWEELDQLIAASATKAPPEPPDPAR
jgi:antitoxin (DNA-binding transcriptional repressor) of toxin-antitoxin stability system